MDRLKLAEETQAGYLKYLDENDGDIHYYKVQYFSFRYKRETKDGLLTPQGEFDLDAEDYLNRYQCENKEDFKYMGKEMISMKKSEPRSEHHKIFVKSSLLRPMVLQLIDEDQYFVPVRGKILSYQQFFAKICKIRGEDPKKRKAKDLKEMNNIAKKNDLTQINAMEVANLKLEERKYSVLVSDIDRRIKELDDHKLGVKSVPDLDSYNTFVESLANKKYEILRDHLHKKEHISKYYNQIRELHEAKAIRKTAIATGKNNKKKMKRVEKQVERKAIDNGLKILDMIIHKEVESAMEVLLAKVVIQIDNNNHNNMWNPVGRLTKADISTTAISEDKSAIQSEVGQNGYKSPMITNTPSSSSSSLVIIKPSDSPFTSTSNPLDEAWKLLHDPAKVIDMVKLTSYLEEIGVTTSSDFTDCDEETIAAITNYLKQVPRNKFTKLITESKKP